MVIGVPMRVFHLRENPLTRRLTTFSRVDCFIRQRMFDIAGSFILLWRSAVPSRAGLGLLDGA